MSKVLLVEDDNNLREIFEMRLQAEGYETSVASDGEEALVVALKDKPDLIIADVMMPKMSGFEMVETLRASPDMADVKVIMMTALGQAEDQARGEKLGVVKYLVKSQVTLEDFVQTVKGFLGTGGGEAGPNSGAGGQENQVVNNARESENKMDDSNPTPTNPAPSGDGAMGGNNPISDAPAGDGQMTTDQQQAAVDGQVKDAMGGGGQPPAGGDMPTGDDPVAPAPGGDMPASEPPKEDGGDAAPQAPTPGM